MSGWADQNDIAIKTRQDRVACHKARNALGNRVFRIGELDAGTPGTLGGHTISESLGGAMPEQRITHAAEKRVLAAAAMIVAARFAQEQGLVRHHAAAHLVGRGAHFDTTVNLAF